MGTLLQSQWLPIWLTMLLALPRLLAAKEIVEHPYHVARQHNHAPYKQYRKDGLRYEDTQNAQ